MQNGEIINNIRPLFDIINANSIREWRIRGRIKRRRVRIIG